MHNPINENIILDCCLMSKTSIHYIMEYLKPEDFFDAKRRNIFEVIKDLYEKKAEISLSSIYKHLVEQKKLEEYKSTFSEILRSWTGGSINDYVESLRDDSARRQINLLLRQKSEELTDKNYSLETLYYDIDTQIKNITQNKNSAVKNFQYLADMTVEDLADSDRYYMTGITDLDKQIHGFFQTDLNLIGARPSIGKTALVQNILIHIAQRYLEEDVLWFSLEMPQIRLARRGVSQLAKIDSFQIRSKKYFEGQKDQVREGMLKLARMKNLNIVDDRFKLEEILAISRRLAMTKPLSAIAIDYIQLIKHNVKGMTRDQMLGDIGKELKLLAKELKVPVIAISSLKREVDFREDKRPVLADLRESGSLEYDADVILFLYKNSKGISQNEYFLESAKNRDGKLLTVELYFDPAITTFTSTGI